MLRIDPSVPAHHACIVFLDYVVTHSQLSYLDIYKPRSKLFHSLFYLCLILVHFRTLLNLHYQAF